MKIETYKGLKIFRGLIFSKKKNILLVLPYEHKARIHTFFVFFPFTAYFLNSIIYLVDTQKMKPFRVYKSKKPAKYILEVYENKRLKNFKVYLNV